MKRGSVSEGNVLMKVTWGHRRQVFIMKGNLCVCVCVKKVGRVPEIGSRCPFQSQAGNVHSSIHQQEENGHNAGDGVELP